MVKSETRWDAEIQLENPSPRLLGKKFRESRKVKIKPCKNETSRLIKNAFEISRSCQNFPRPTFFEVPFATSSVDVDKTWEQRGVRGEGRGRGQDLLEKNSLYPPFNLSPSRQISSPALKMAAWIGRLRMYVLSLVKINRLPNCVERPQINKQSSKYNGVQLSVIKPKPNQLLTTELLKLLTSQQNSNRSKNNTCLKMFFTSLTFGVVWDYYCSKLKGKQYKLIT